MSRQFYLLLTKWRGRTALCFIINLGYFKNNFGGLKSIQVAVVLVVTSLEGNDFFLIRNFLTPWGCRKVKKIEKVIKVVLVLIFELA